MINKEEIKKEFYKNFVVEHPGDSGVGGNDPQEPVCEVQYENPDEIVDFFLSKFSSHQQELAVRIEEIIEEKKQSLLKWGVLKPNWIIVLTDLNREIASIINQSNKV